MQESNKEGDFCTQHTRWKKHSLGSWKEGKHRLNIYLGLWYQVENSVPDLVGGARGLLGSYFNSWDFFVSQKFQI